MEDNISDLLEALAKQSIGSKNIQIIVADNGSSDSTTGKAAAAIKQYGLNALLLHIKQPGSYIAHNAAIKKVNAPLIAFTDADCIPHTNWLAEGIKAVNHDDKLPGISRAFGKSGSLVRHH